MLENKINFEVTKAMTRLNSLPLNVEPFCSIIPLPTFDAELADPLQDGGAPLSPPDRNVSVRVLHVHFDAAVGGVKAGVERKVGVVQVSAAGAPQAVVRS